MQLLSGRDRRVNVALESRNLCVQAQSIVRITRVVSNLERSESFYRTVLGFRTVAQEALDPAVATALGLAEMTALEVRMRLGQDELALVQFDARRRNYPRGSRSNDLWFQHLAIVVRDMEAAYAQLRSSGAWRAISRGGPQTLPGSSGAVRAFKFRDPDGHPLELLWLPAGRGRPIWHEPWIAGSSAPLFLGIDHSALAVSSTRRSLAFYRLLGLRICARSSNSGPAQSRLDGLNAARVRVTGLRAAATAGPGLELLAYRPPGRARDTAPVADLSTDWTTLEVVAARGAVAARGVATARAAPAGDRAVRDAAARAPQFAAKPRGLVDPDGHRFVLVTHGVGSAGRPA